jgi:hypothetical protein
VVAIKTHEEVQELTLTELLGVFLSETQAPLSVVGAGILPCWEELRSRLGLHGWHTKEEAIEAIESKLKVR